MKNKILLSILLMGMAFGSNNIEENFEQTQIKLYQLKEAISKKRATVFDNYEQCLAEDSSKENIDKCNLKKDQELKKLEVLNNKIDKQLEDIKNFHLNKVIRKYYKDNRTKIKLQNDLK